jgi:hypothetical protein
LEDKTSNLKLYLGLGILGIIFVAGVGVMVVRAYRATMPRNGENKSTETTERP